MRNKFSKTLLGSGGYAPADSLSLHLFDSGIGIIETVVDVQVAGGVLLSVKTQLSPKARTGLPRGGSHPVSDLGSEGDGLRRTDLIKGNIV